MVFSSLEFLFLYLPVCLTVYFLIPRRHLKIRNLVLFLFSLVFYAWSGPRYVFLILFSTVVDFICGHFVGKYREKNKKLAKRFVFLSVFINIGLLAFFKYTDFIISNLSRIPFLSFLKPIGITLPVGISFYTFQTMSYTIDVYRGEAAAQDNIVTFGAYVSMFPQLIAGPIVRYRDVDSALRSREQSIERFASGIRRFSVGLCKKVLLANTAGELFSAFSSDVASNPNILGAWLGILFYSFQIYFDFSGYSDMAIGLGRIMGFDFPENFNYPYISASITEFWRRWHITLSTWFREYVYIPLGGSRCSRARTFFNLFVVWLLTGLWHGASWNFVLWGLYYCVILIIEKSLLKGFLEKHRIFAHIYSLLFVLFGWFIFVSCDLEKPFQYLRAMFSGPFVSQMSVYHLVRSTVFLVILIIASTPFCKNIYKRFEGRSSFSVIISILCVASLALCTAYLVDSSYNPFLYFRF